MTGWSSRKRLELSSLLLKAEIHPSFEIGQRVGRGFSDVGFEEFLVLPGDKLVSLNSGLVTSIKSLESKHFFPMYSATDLVRHLCNHPGNEVFCKYDFHYSEWKVSFKSTITTIEASGTFLEEILLELWLSFLNLDVPNQRRNLVIG